jgi:pyrrolidone-carboxylate peptidase
MVRLLLTGFGPFGALAENPSATVAERAGARLAACGVRCEFRALATSVSAVHALYGALRGEADLIVVHVGVDLGGALMKLECAAHNIAHFRMPDADGVTLAGAPISDALPFNHPLRNPLDLAALARQLGDGFALSESAGTYLCNYAYFTGLARVGTDLRGCLFVHIPPFAEIDCDTAVARIVRLCEAVVALCEREDPPRAQP